MKKFFHFYGLKIVLISLPKSRCLEDVIFELIDVNIKTCHAIKMIAMLDLNKQMFLG